jgi:hypothetical protein
MGYYDTSLMIPIDIQFTNEESRGKEIKALKNNIIQNKEDFKNMILICDRLYFAYGLMDFLIDNGIKFVIRGKGACENIDEYFELPINTPKRKTLEKLRPNIRLVKKSCIEETTITHKIKTNKENKNKNNKKKGKKNKPKSKQYKIQLNNYHTFITNLPKNDTFTDDKIADLYNSRWSIEVFYGLLKKNLKFRQIITSNDANLKKQYYADMIIMHINHIIKQHYLLKNNVQEGISTKIKRNGDIAKCTVKINDTLIIKGMYKQLLNNIANGTLNDNMIDIFCKQYVKIVKNECNRKFKRVSKTPFTKWYTVSHANNFKLNAIIDAIINKKADKLRKDLKTIAKKIIKINGRRYNQ